MWRKEKVCACVSFSTYWFRDAMFEVDIFQRLDFFFFSTIAIYARATFKQQFRQFQLTSGLQGEGGRRYRVVRLFVAYFSSR